MTTITITKENFGQKMSILYKKMNTFGEIKINIEEKKDPTIRLQKLIEDPDNTSYGPFESVEDFLKHLHSN